MDSLDAIIEAHELDLDCSACRRIIRRPLGWVRQHREMRCPSCDTTIVLGTSRINAAIRNVERQMTELHRQLSEKIKKSSPC